MLGKHDTPLIIRLREALKGTRLGIINLNFPANDMPSYSGNQMSSRPVVDHFRTLSERPSLLKSECHYPRCPLIKNCLCLSPRPFFTL